MTQVKKDLRIGFLLLEDEVNGRCGWIAGLYFIKNCLNAIACLPDNEIPQLFIFIPDSFTDKLIDSTMNHDKWLTIVTIPDSHLSDFRQHHLVEEKINNYQCDIYFPMLTKPRFVLNGASIGWIPDYQDRHLKQYFNADEACYRDVINSFISSYCSYVLCTSNSVRDDFNKFYPDYAYKGIVVHFRSFINKQLLEMDPEDTLIKYGIQGKKYIYMPNQFWTHKNHMMVFEAWKQLKYWGSDYLLICTGSCHDPRFSNYHEQILAYLRDHNLTDNVKILGFIDRKEQIQFYRAASAILQPSLFEGWSTSLEDAKALGKLILASDISVHQEQCESNTLFFDPYNPDLLAKMINMIWDDLPSGHNAATEKDANAYYQASIVQFGRDLVHLFGKTIRQAHNEHNVDTIKTLAPLYNSALKLPVYLNRQLLARQQDCDERLELINGLHKAFNRKGLLERILNIFK